MDIKKNKSSVDTIFLLCIGTLLLASITSAIFNTIELAQPASAFFLKSFIVLFMLRIIFENKYTLILTALLAFTSVVAVLVNLLTAEYYYESILYQINNFALQLILYLNGLLPISSVFELTISWALHIALGIFIFIFAYLWFNFIILFIVSSLLFAIVLNSGFFYLYTSFYIFIFSIVAYLVKYLNFKSVGSKSTYGLYALPITVIAIGVSLTMPTPEEGFTKQIYDNFFARPFDAVNRAINDQFRPKHFSLAQTGFGATNVRRLGGNVATNYNIVMRVRSNEPTLYLTGAILDTYTGYAWVNTFEDTYTLTFDGINIELLEQKASMLNIWNLNGYRNMPGSSGVYYFGRRFFHPVFDTYLEQYVQPDITFSDIYWPAFNDATIYIDTYNYSTFSVFYTGILINSTHAPYGNALLRTQNATITSYELKPRNTTYVLVYSQFDDSINLTYILKESHQGLFANVKNNLHYDLIFHVNDISISYETLLQDYLIPRANWIREVYTQLPEHFPSRVVELAQTVTYYATSDYEKARLLEAYLRTFEYTLEPGDVPYDRDFVDYFLFDKQRGYCVYYASAFVTMARALGLPARYVEGFIAIGNQPVGYRAVGYNDDDDSDFFYIRNRQGHAWAEVYFEGFGWHRFDPTPPTDTFGTIFASTVAEHPAFDWENFWDDSWMWWDEEMELLQGRAAASLNDLYTTEAQTIDFATEEVTEATLPLQQLVILSTLYAAIVLSLLLSARVTFVRYVNAKVKKATNNDAAIIYFEKMLKYLQLFNYEKTDAETSMAFAKRITRFSFFVDNTEYNMTHVTEIFLKAKYSKHTITQQERALMAASLKAMDDRIKSYISKRSYYTMKYIFATV